jgi:hypothetical protein
VLILAQAKTRVGELAMQTRRLPKRPLGLYSYTPFAAAVKAEVYSALREDTAQISSVSTHSRLNLSLPIGTSAVIRIAELALSHTCQPSTNRKLALTPARVGTNRWDGGRCFLIP